MQRLERFAVGQEALDDAVGGVVVGDVAQRDAVEFGRQEGPVPATEAGRVDRDALHLEQEGQAVELGQPAADDVQRVQVRTARQQTKVEPSQVAVSQPQPLGGVL